MATKDHDAVIILKRRAVEVGALFEHNPYFRVCPPNRPARAACPFDNDVEIRGNTVRCRYLKACSCVRDIPHGTFKFWRPVTQNDLRVFEYPLAKDGSIFLHDPTLIGQFL